MDSQTTNVAVIGAGYWGKNLVRNFEALGALGAICETDAATRKRFGEQYPAVRCTSNLEEVLADQALSAVAVATPAETHAEVVRAALLAGKDVYVEKPLCLSEPEGRELNAWPASTVGS